MCAYCYRCGALTEAPGGLCRDCYAELATRQDQLDEERLEGDAAGEEGVDE